MILPKTFITGFLLFISGIPSIYAQERHPAMDVLCKGATITMGIGNVSVKDNYISGQKYSGPGTSVGASWLYNGISSAYRLTLDFTATSKLKNNQVSANLLQGGFNLDYLYPVGKFNLFSREVRAFIGPSPDFYIYYRKQHIASGGDALYSAYSFAMFLSMDFNATLVMPVSKRLYLENSDKLALISLGGRLPDVSNSEATFFKVVSVFSGIRGYSEFLLRYEWLSHLAVKGGYRFGICQSSSWDYLISVSDQFLIAATIKF